MFIKKCVTNKVLFISVGGLFCPTSCTEETSKGSRGRAVSSMQTDFASILSNNVLPIFVL